MKNTQTHYTFFVEKSLVFARVLFTIFLLFAIMIKNECSQGDIIPHFVEKEE